MSNSSDKQVTQIVADNALALYAVGWNEGDEITFDLLQRAGAWGAANLSMDPRISAERARKFRESLDETS